MSQQFVACLFFIFYHLKNTCFFLFVLYRMIGVAEKSNPTKCNSFRLWTGQLKQCEISSNKKWKRRMPNPFMKKRIIHVGHHEYFYFYFSLLLLYKKTTWYNHTYNTVSFQNKTTQLTEYICMVKKVTIFLIFWVCVCVWIAADMTTKVSDIESIKSINILHLFTARWY